MRNLRGAIFYMKKNILQDFHISFIVQCFFIKYELY